MAWDDLSGHSAAFRKGYLSALSDVGQDAIQVRSTNGTISDLEEAIHRRAEAIFLTLSEAVPNSNGEPRALRGDRERDAQQLKEEGIADGLKLAAAAARTRAWGESGDVHNVLLVFAAWCDQEAHRGEPNK